MSGGRGASPLRATEPEAEGRPNSEDRCARELLAGFFAEFGIAPGPHLDRLIGRFVAAAAHRRQSHAMELGQLALEAAELELRAWFAGQLGRAVLGDPSLLLVGRVAYRACGTAERWPESLLAPDLPQEFTDALRAATPPAVPPEQPGLMLEQPFETWSPRDLARRPRALRLASRRSAAA